MARTITSKVHKALRPYVSDELRSKGRRREDIQRLRDNATKVRHLEYREAVVRMHYSLQYPIKVIADTLCIAPKKVQWYLDWALERVLNMPEEERLPEVPRKKKKKKKSRSSPGIVLAATSTIVTVDSKTAKQAWYLYVNAVPVEEIAELLDKEPREISDMLGEKIALLNASELNTTENARRKQIVQLDMAVRAIMPFVTGEDIDGQPHPIDRDYIDRFIRLMEQKAKLQGLNAPVKVNLTARLEVIAQMTDLTIEDVQELMQEVLESYAELGAG